MTTSADGGGGRAFCRPLLWELAETLLVRRSISCHRPQTRLRTTTHYCVLSHTLVSRGHGRAWLFGCSNLYGKNVRLSRKKFTLRSEFPTQVNRICGANSSLGVIAATVGPPPNCESVVVQICVPSRLCG